MTQPPLRLKKADKDHRGEWDLVLDNNGTTVVSVRVVPDPLNARLGCWQVRIMIPTPTDSLQPWDEWYNYQVKTTSAVYYFLRLGVDTAPLEKLIAEKEATQ